MNRTRSTLAAGACAALLALAGVSPALAQSSAAAPAATSAAAEPGAHAAPQGHHARQRTMTPEQRQHMREQRQQRQAQRVAAFKQKLALTAEQEPAWNTFQQAMQPGQRHARLDARGADWQQLTTPERIERMRAVRMQRAAAFDRRADAALAFYAALQPAQQKTFDAEGARMMARFGQGPRGHHHKHGAHRGAGHPHHGSQGAAAQAPAQQ